VAKHLSPAKINPDCIEHATIYRMIDTKMKGTRHHNIQLYQVVKSWQLLHQESDSTEVSPYDGGT
jgi:hypothetical protein